VPVVTWLCVVHTADETGAGTDANVHLVVYGKNRDGESVKSDEVGLDNSGDNFESGQQDQFKIETVDVGRPYKIRVWHDNAGSFAAWKLDRVGIRRIFRDVLRPPIFHRTVWSVISAHILTPAKRDVMSRWSCLTAAITVSQSVVSK